MVKLNLINKVKKMNEDMSELVPTNIQITSYTYTTNVKVYIYLIEHHGLYAVTKKLSKFFSNYRFATTLGNNNNNTTIRSVNTLHSM